MRDEQEVHEVSPPAPEGRIRWSLIAALFFLATTLGGAYYLIGERQEAAQMAANYDQMRAVLSQTREQLDTVNRRLSALSTMAETRPAAAEGIPAAANGESSPRHSIRRSAHKTQKRPPADDPRWKKVQAQLDEHQKQLEVDQQNLEKTRSELEGKLDSTRDDLGNSIARNHAELVELQKRGEKNYSEFDLTKSKRFNRVGPVSIALRKANTKHQYCDLELIVDDNRISKKHTNLYEPVLLYPADYAQPVEIVINAISKGEARGYVSAPKLRQSPLATRTSPEPPSTQPALSTANLEHRPVAAPQ